MNKAYDNIIIGSGITGLTIAKLLSEKNFDFLIIDKNKIPGGKIATIESKNYKLDLGFQILLKKYPSLNLFPEINKIKFKKFHSGFGIKKNDKIYKVFNPIKSFKHFFYDNSFPGFTLKDKYLLIKLMMYGILCNKENKSVKSFLKEFGFSDNFINDFFVSFFQGVFLDKDLKVPLKYFLFIYKLFSISDVVIPHDGINEIIKEIIKNLNKSKIKQGVKVVKIEENSISTNTGEKFIFNKLFCTSPELEEIFHVNINKKKFINIKYSGTQSFYFIGKLKDVDDKLIYLFPESENISNISLKKINEDEYIICASCLSIDVTKEIIHNEVISYFKSIKDLVFIENFKIHNALPSNNDFFNFENKGFCNYSSNIFFAGDFLSEPSLNGSIQSGIDTVRYIYK